MWKIATNRTVEQYNAIKDAQYIPHSSCSTVKNEETREKHRRGLRDIGEEATKAVQGNERETVGRASQIAGTGVDKVRARRQSDLHGVEVPGKTDT